MADSKKRFDELKRGDIFLHNEGLFIKLGDNTTNNQGVCLDGSHAGDVRNFWNHEAVEVVEIAIARNFND
ncbi:MAG: hypothetical protein J6X45_01520 [Lachnospiraceae bacterium]|nr:hypothetical protein [Lachnospiraceae bacterium]